MAETKATEKDGSWYSGCHWSKHITSLLPVRQTSHSNLSLGDREVCHVIGPKVQPAYNFARPLFSLEPVPLKLLRRAGPESLSHYAQHIEMKARRRQLIYLHLSGKRCTSRTNYFTPLERIHQKRLGQIMTFRSYECAPQKTKVVTSLVLLDKR